MDNPVDIAVVGSDPRLHYCAERLRSNGLRAFRYSESDLPDGAACYLFAPPFTRAKLRDVSFAKKGVTVFAGAADEGAKSSVTSRGAVMIDYCESETFARENAALTSEAAITVYIGASATSLRGAKTLVSGFGRIGKALSLLLKAHGAEVTASARKLSDIELIRAYGCAPVETSSMRGEYDVIFNTVPANVFTRDVTDRTKTDYYIELASAPFGTENPSVFGLRTRVIRASGLPGKVLPVSAGRLIADTVCTIIKEPRI